jgi:hypothetical protein
MDLLPPELIRLIVLQSDGVDFISWLCASSAVHDAITDKDIETKKKQHLSRVTTRRIVNYYQHSIAQTSCHKLNIPRR